MILTEIGPISEPELRLIIKIGPIFSFNQLPLCQLTVDGFPELCGLGLAVRSGGSVMWGNSLEVSVSSEAMDHPTLRRILILSKLSIAPYLDLWKSTLLDSSISPHFLPWFCFILWVSILEQLFNEAWSGEMTKKLLAKVNKVTALLSALTFAHTLRCLAGILLSQEPSFKNISMNLTSSSNLLLLCNLNLCFCALKLNDHDSWLFVL